MEYKQDPSKYALTMMYDLSLIDCRLPLIINNIVCISDSTYWTVADVRFHASDTF